MIKVLMISLLFVSAAQAENYYVEPMVCKGQWEKQPDNAHESYEYGVLKVVSFKSVVAADCSKVQSSGTAADFGPEAVKNATLDTSDGYLGVWFAAPLQKQENTVTIPSGLWGNTLELKIASSNVINGVKIDKLIGREKFQNTYYNLKCEAIVVEDPSHVENNTKDCK